MEYVGRDVMNVERSGETKVEMEVKRGVEEIRAEILLFLRGDKCLPWPLHGQLILQWFQQTFNQETLLLIKQTLCAEALRGSRWSRKLVQALDQEKEEG